MFFELLWRDFFRMMGKKHGNAIFHKGGTKGEAPQSRTDPAAFETWMNGLTGSPFVDANMRELALTGFMSNRGRQNVASYLAKDLRLDWRLGAEYFESVLIDYDVTSNWCNWNYVAGVGSDPREDRYFNILTQARRYDEDGAYVKLWCPELKALPCELVHQPEAMTQAQQRSYNVWLGVDYPWPLMKKKTTSRR